MECYGMSEQPQNSKEWRLIDKLLTKSLNEQTKSRRWSVFFKLLTFAYLFALLWILGISKWEHDPVTRKSHTALIEINGIILEGEQASADAIVTGLTEAFEDPKSKAIILRVNSPGGSPVQAGFVYDEMMRLRERYPEKKVYAAITDMGASGAYYIASAADAIYADKASIIGSIGVISMGFGFTEMLEKLGIERRVLTAGENKAMLDPFLPVSPEDASHFQTVLKNVHNQFITSVKNGRGTRLDHINVDEIFSGLLWTGEQAVKLGLVDGLGSPGYVAREVVGESSIVNYTRRPSPLDAFANRLGVSIANRLSTMFGSFELF